MWCDVIKCAQNVVHLTQIYSKKFGQVIWEQQMTLNLPKQQYSSSICVIIRPLIECVKYINRPTNEYYVYWTVHHCDS